MITVNQEEILAGIKTTEQILQEKITQGAYKNIDAFVRFYRWMMGTDYAKYISLNFEDGYVVFSICISLSNGPRLILICASEHDNENSDCSESCNGKVSFEHFDSFNRWDIVRHKYYIPKTKKEFDKILQLIKSVDSPNYRNGNHSQEFHQLLSSMEYFNA